MRHAFCTLFDRDFLFRGLALYESLEEHAGDFTLWILCMDDTVHDALTSLVLPHAELVRLADFEDEELRTAKRGRSPLEYCWTCTPSLPLWVLRNNPDLESVTYVDADLMFFSDPEPLFGELGDGSVSIVEHRYAPRWQHLVAQSGIYNVEYLTFRNDARGLAVLEWWRDRCVEWCYDRVEDGKVADQMYLDDWPQRFPGIVVLQDPGAGLAPWNVEAYDIAEGLRGITVDGVPLIFYHYSSFVITDGETPGFIPASPDYAISERDERILYAPYKEAIARAINKARAVAPEYSFGIKLSEKGRGSGRIARRARLARFVKAVPPLRWLWNALSRATDKA